MRELLAHRLEGTIEVEAVIRYAIWAVVFVAAGTVLYAAALLLSHLAAFEVEMGLKSHGFTHILSVPLGFFCRYPSAKLRKVINVGAESTHNFLAHQLPDLAETLITPIMLLVVLLFFDWRLGLASLVPIFLALVTFSRMMSSAGQEFQKQYFANLDEMGAEAVEYVRGIPVVKTFGQSVYAFKRFYKSIINYRDMVYRYTLLWGNPMSLYQTVI